MQAALQPAQNRAALALPRPRISRAAGFTPADSEAVTDSEKRPDSPAPAALTLCCAPHPLLGWGTHQAGAAVWRRMLGLANAGRTFVVPAPALAGAFQVIQLLIQLLLRSPCPQCGRTVYINGHISTRNPFMVYNMSNSSDRYFMVLNQVS